MKTLTLTLVALSLLAATAAPARAAAGCTTEYQFCLNDSYDLNTVLRSLADFACFDDYLTCVSRRLLFG